MCGIVGYIGGSDGPAVIDALRSGLSGLDYRGYDSAGVALVDDELTVFAVVTGDDEQARKTIGNVREIQSRGAPVVVITDGESDAVEHGEDVLWIPPRQCRCWRTSSSSWSRPASRTNSIGSSSPWPRKRGRVASIRIRLTQSSVPVTFRSITKSAISHVAYQTGSMMGFRWPGLEVCLDTGLLAVGHRCEL
ncbi:hypothetical protein [Natronorarus salvus]|uniref:hypothetical protein n=1 Tax=Natronorarus salvus TaxID=3117733 RepID=UPI002F26255F